MVGQFPASCAWPGGPSGWEFCASCSSALSTAGVLHLLCLTLSRPAWGSCHGDLRRANLFVALEPPIQVCVYLSSVL